MKNIFVVGTDTDVGKTLVTAGLVYKLNKENINTCVFKPVLSGAKKVGNDLIPEDVSFVKKVADLEEDFKNMNSYSFVDAVSPHIAAERALVHIDKNKIIKDYNSLSSKYDCVIVEGAGGIIVPIIRNKYYLYDLIKDLDLEVVLVIKAGVGTINHTLLTVEFLRNKDIKIKGIIVNGYTGSFYEDDNIKVIKDITNIDILGIINKIEKVEEINNVQREFDDFSLWKF